MKWKKNRALSRKLMKQIAKKKLSKNRNNWMNKIKWIEENRKNNKVNMSKNKWIDNGNEKK